MSSLLASIDSPDDVRRLDHASLRALAGELRAFVLDSVSQTGGHLSSNLGTIELTVALHAVFDTPRDRIVWDVGHQTYAHKILTGRREDMARLRMLRGISGFPRRCESEYDAFGTAHSSTSISAALGMAHAARLAGEDRPMNNAGGDGADLLVILNDNEMSISPAVGALTRHLGRLLTGPYARARRRAKGLSRHVPDAVARLLRRAEKTVKGLVVPSTLFEALGFAYYGPIDGHDLDALLPVLRALRHEPGPRLLHVVTRKGNGYELAEADPVRYHGVSRFVPRDGLSMSPAAAARPAFCDVFGDWLCDAAARDRRLVAITPAMREGSGMVRFAREHPDRFFDVGIAEQHAITFAAGLACETMHPVVAIYSTFLQRGYDQMIHDVCLQDLPVLFAIDRAGLVGADGATHHGAFDMAFLRCLPNIVVMAPADAAELRRMLDFGLAHRGPAAVRYPRGSGSGVALPESPAPLSIGKARVLQRGAEVALLAFGSMAGTALAVGRSIGATVVDMRWIKPLDVATIVEVAASHALVVTLEEGVVAGGVGSGVVEAMCGAGCPLQSLLQLGLPDRFIDHGDPAQLIAIAGLDAQSVSAAIAERLAQLRRGVRPSRRIA